MKIRDFGFLTDANIHPQLIAHVRALRFDVIDAKENGWSFEKDEVLLARSFAMGRVVFTHDNDFGYLTTILGLPAIGIVQIRPGHGDILGSIATVDEVLCQDPDVTPPFILVAKRTRRGITIRTRAI